MISAEVSKAIAALPPARDGQSVTVEDVRPMLREMVDALPAPRDGASVTVEDVMPVIAAEVSKAIAALPPARDGQSVTVEDVRPMLQEMVDALPAPERGPEGRLPTVKDWVDRVHYEGEVVIHAGSTWQAVRDTGRQPPHADWACLARAGNEGLSFEIEGTFDPSRTDYRRLSVVAMNGGSFIARRDNPGTCPGDGWQLIASPGKRGQPGERGPAGKARWGGPDCLS